MSKELWGSGYVFKRGKTFWFAYSVGGKRYRVSAHTTDRAKAVKLLQQHTGEAASGRAVLAPVASAVTLGDMIEGLRLDYARKENRSVRCIERAAACWIAGFKGGAAAKAISIDRDAISRYIAARRTTLIKHDGKLQPTSNGTLNQEMRLLRRAFNVQVEGKKLSHDHVPTMPMLADAPPRQGFLTPAQFEKLHDALPRYLQDIVRFLYLSGWRKQEVLKLEWRDVELDHDASGDIIGGRVKLRIENSKNKEPRLFPLTGETLAIFVRADVRVLDGDVQPGDAGVQVTWSESSRVFQRNGSPIGDFRKAWKAARKAAGIRDEVRMVHDLRRSAVKNYSTDGVPDAVAMQSTGHKTRSVYLRYRIVDEGDLLAASAKVQAGVKARAKTAA